MALTARSWSFLWRLKRRIANVATPPEDGTESRLRWIAEHAPGRSFVDVGGLFQMEGDIAFAAEKAGAGAVTCFDAGDPDLCGFAAKHRDRGSSVRFVQGDLEDPEAVRNVGPHDIVWCTGVIYHSPSPARQLMYLREITRELLYLGTLTIPEVPGFPHACIYYPHLDERVRKQFAAGYRWAHGGSAGMIGIGTALDDAPMRGHGNCWWGITRSALRSMLATARFEVVEERRTFASPFLTEVVARPVAADPLLPPISYYRERGEHRERGEPRPPFETYYEEERAAGSTTGRSG